MDFRSRIKNPTPTRSVLRNPTPRDSVTLITTCLLLNFTRRFVLHRIVPMFWNATAVCTQRHWQWST